VTKDAERFSVTITVTQLREHASGLVYVTGDDAEGYQVIATMTKRQVATMELTVGQYVTVPGHSIYAYSGEVGPWGPARVPPPVERTR
jgi:hypothetical protein